MTELTLDQAAATQLSSANDYLKLRDPAGQVIGYFLPAEPSTPKVIFGVKSPFSREEIERRLRDGRATARPLREIFAEWERKYPGQFQWDSA
jgi:hypothetical protein